MSRRTMESLKEILCKELDEYAMSGQISRSDLADIQMLTASIKNIEKITMMDGQEHSFDGSISSRNGGSYRASYRGGSYGDGYAIRSGRGRSEMSSRRSGGYSYGDDNQPAIQALEDMLNEGDMSPEEEKMIRRTMDILKK